MGLRCWYQLEIRFVGLITQFAMFFRVYLGLRLLLKCLVLEVKTIFDHFAGNLRIVIRSHNSELCNSGQSPAPSARPSFRNNTRQGVRRCNDFTHLTDQNSEADIKILGGYASLSRFGCIVRHFVARS